MNSISVPILLTARHPAEGGDNQLSAKHRLELIENHIEGDSVAFIDIEVGSMAEMKAASERAKALQRKVIASFHDFEKTPDPSLLREQIERGIDQGADIVKLAVRLRSSSDLRSLIALLEEEQRIPLALMGMGDLGKISRLLFAKLGSALNYGYLFEPNAPGQWSAAEFKQLISKL